MIDLDTTFFYIGVVFAILLPFGILKYIFREKLVVSMYQQPEAIKRDLGYQRRFVPFLRIFLWLSPLYLFLVPWFLYKYSGGNGITIFASSALMTANIYVEYRFRKWLYQYLEKSIS